MIIQKTKLEEIINNLIGNKGNKVINPNSPYYIERNSLNIKFYENNSFIGIAKKKGFVYDLNMYKEGVIC